MPFIAYSYTNPDNGKCYVGITSNPARRKSEHIYSSKSRCCTKWQRAIKKYGIDHFEFQVLRSGLSLEEARRVERQEILHRDSYRRGYNSSPGGDGADPEKMMGDKNVSRRPDVRIKLRASVHARIDDIRQQMLNDNPMDSAANREKVRLSKIGKARSADTKRKISESRVQSGVALGENNPAAKIDERAASAIRDSDEPRKVLADRFGISVSTVAAIRGGRIWKTR